MIKPVFVRSIFGVVFALLGFYLVARFTPPQSAWRVFGAITSGLFGLFILPIVSRLLGRAVKHLTENIALEVVRQLRSRLPPPPKFPRHPKMETTCPALVLDTSAIIDGRVADVIKTGFLHGKIIVPNFVLSELKEIADSSQTLRRNRGRRGLEILEDLKKDKKISFQVVEARLRRGRKVDENLVRFAKKHQGAIVTCDLNLNKVAKVSGVAVLNVNELANAVKTPVLPGEKLAIKIISQGKEAGQGVGYLDDGTMIVVEGGEKFMGKKIKVVVSRLLQTEAGRMVFAKPKINIPD